MTETPQAVVNLVNSEIGRVTHSLARADDEIAGHKAMIKHLGKKRDGHKKRIKELKDYLNDISS